MVVLFVGLIVFYAWMFIGGIVSIYAWNDDDTEAYWNLSVIDRIAYIIRISMTWPTRFFRKS